MVVNLSLEDTIRKNIVKYLNEIPFTKATVWPQQGRTKGHPDIICSHMGIMILIETKRPGELQTPLQKQTMEEWREARTVCIVATHVDQVKEAMEKAILPTTLGGSAFNVVNTVRPDDTLGKDR